MYEKTNFSCFDDAKVRRVLAQTNSFSESPFFFSKQDFK